MTGTGFGQSGQARRGKLLYREAFDKGPGHWKVGKDKEDGGWNRNVLGRKGHGVPLGWSPSGGLTGGLAFSESPWYFDSNHGEFMWFYLLLVGPLGEEWKDYRHLDLRGAVVSITLRSREMQLKGTRMYLWIQGYRGPHPRVIYNPGDPLVSWALTSQPIGEELLDGEWHGRDLVLTNDEGCWSQMGLLNRGLPGRIIVEQSLTFATGFLDHLLNGNHYNFGFILGGVDPNDPPSGRIEVDEISLWSRG